MKKVSFLKGAFYLLFFFFLSASFFLITKPERTASFKEKLTMISNVVRYFPFTVENSLKEWEEKILRGRVVYVIEKYLDESYVRAKSDKAASALYYKIKLDIKKNPLISWKWRVDEFPKRVLPETIEGIREEDFAARVYVIFPAAFFTQSKVIEYIWSETLPAGTSGQSGYSKNIKVLVLQTGKATKFYLEKRDIYEDYVNLFKDKPKLDVGAVAFMTDADSTKTSAGAVYDEINIGYR